MTYTHGHAESVLRSHRWRTADNSAAYLLPHLKPTDRLLDVGSGPGTLTADLARRVGSVTALEITDAAASLTRDELARQGVAGTVDVGNVHALPYDAGQFDVVHAHQVLQHVADPVQALREMARVSRPGGVVAVRDCDYASFAWYPQLPALDRWLEVYRGAAKANGGEPEAGRHLLRWAHAAGLHDLEATSSTWCFATPDDRAWWGGMWADRMLSSTVTKQVLRQRRATPAELEEIAAAWREWAAHPDGWLSLQHGELLISAT